MKSIEITTPQNVTIDYKAATVFERSLAFIIDFFIIGAGIGILSILITVFVPRELQNAVSIALLAPLYLSYHFVFEVFHNGASPGKRALGLRVVKLTNEPVGVYDYFMRWAFRLIDILASSGILAAITIASSPKNQRIGDYLADTTVIKVVKSGRFSLSKVKELETLKNYEPQYPEVTMFSEENMLVLKEVVERFAKYPGEGSGKTVELTINKIESTLGIQAKTRDVNFLRTLIKDYVALTR